MNLDDLKETWKSMNERIDRDEAFLKKTAEIQFRSKGENRLRQIRQRNVILVGIFFLEMLFLLAVLLGNPFDFVYFWQYIPVVLLLTLVCTGFGRSVFNLRGIVKLHANHQMLDFLENAAHFFDQTERFNQWFRISFLGSGILTVLSFIPNLTRHREFTAVIPFLLLWVALSWGMYWLIFKSGWVSISSAQKFRQEATEWQTLKALLKETNG